MIAQGEEENEEIRQAHAHKLDNLTISRFTNALGNKKL